MHIYRITNRIMNKKKFTQLSLWLLSALLAPLRFRAGQRATLGINEAWIQEYLNLARSQGLSSIRAHFNVLAWGDDAEELRQIKNDVGSALALMECRPRHNTVDAATLYWAGIPGNAADFPADLLQPLLH